MMQHAVSVKLEDGPEPSRLSQVPSGHDGRIHYANPEDLPSYPSSGLKTSGAAAGAAASLGWSNQKTFEHWKPSESTSAGTAASLGWANQKSYEPWKPTASSSAQTAATLAKDYKMPTAYQPERSSESQRAASLAAGSSLRQSRQGPASPPPSNWGQSAANLAFSAAGTASQAPRDQTSDSLNRRQSMRAANAADTASHHPKNQTVDSLSRQQSMRAANGAVNGARPRAASIPHKYTYPDEENASANALNAASVANRQSSVRAPEGGAVPYTTMSREMFTSRPPVKPEVDEKRHNDVLHASAVAMAKGMYARQQNLIENAKRSGNTDAGTAAARSSSFARRGVESPESDITTENKYPNLQEAAYRLAQERLAKLHDQHQKDREYQDYYGAGKQAPAGGRLGSIRGKLTRRRSSSDGDLITTRKPFQQATHLPKVDEDKRAKDRQALLAAAQRNVKAQMDGMDRRVYEETGRIQPVKMTEWENKAHTTALLRAEARMNENNGKIDLGAGKFMDQEEINAIAARNVQPLLDDINQKAEAERERQIAIKLEEERRKKEAEQTKEREHEIHDIHKKLKDEQKEGEKRRKQEAKEAEKLRKEQEKEEKRRVKEEKRKSKSSPKAAAIALEEQVKADEEMAPIAPIAPVIVPVLRTEAVHTDEAVTDEPTAIRPLADGPPVEDVKAKSKEAKKPRTLSLSKREDDSAVADDEPRSPGRKVKTWFKSYFAPRPRTKSSTSDHPATATDEQSPVSATGSNTAGDAEKGFIGGAALRRESRANSHSSADSSLRNVAFANVNRDTRREDTGLPAAIAAESAIETSPEPTPAVATPAIAAAIPLPEPSPVAETPATETQALDITSSAHGEPVTLRDVAAVRSVSSVSSLSSNLPEEEEEEEESDNDDDIRFEDASPFTRAEMARPYAPPAPFAEKVKPKPEVERPLTPPPKQLDVPKDTMARLSASPVRESRFAEIID